MSVLAPEQILRQRYRSVRRRTVHFCTPLSVEDYVPQPNTDPSNETHTMSDKTHLKNTMLSLKAEQLRFAEKSHPQYLAGAAGGGDEPSDPDASAQAHSSGVLAQSFECPIHTHEHALATLSRIDFGPKAEVTEGAAVNIGGRWFVIGAATDAFGCAGRSYMGISTEAPIHQAVAGAAAGDRVEFRGRTLSIDEVH